MLREKIVSSFSSFSAVISLDLSARIQLRYYRKLIRRVFINNLTTITTIALIILNINEKYFINILTVVQTLVFPNLVLFIYFSFIFFYFYNNVIFLQISCFLTTNGHRATSRTAFPYFSSHYFLHSYSLQFLCSTG